MLVGSLTADQRQRLRFSDPKTNDEEGQTRSNVKEERETLFSRRKTVTRCCILCLCRVRLMGATARVDVSRRRSGLPLLDVDDLVLNRSNEMTIRSHLHLLAVRCLSSGEVASFFNLNLSWIVKNWIPTFTGLRTGRAGCHVGSSGSGGAGTIGRCLVDVNEKFHHCLVPIAKPRLVAGLSSFHAMELV